MEETKKQKNKIRNSVLAQCKRVDLDGLVASAVEQIVEEDTFIRAKIVFAYEPFGHEIPFVGELVKRFPNKKYYYPKMNGKEMCFEHNEPDIIFVPAIAVDADGNRLGRGWGSYDKFLNGQSNALTICVVPECAVVDNLPAEPHDIPVSKVLIIK